MNGFNSEDSILIVGGTGFIGRHLIQRCLKETPYITCLGLSGRHKSNLFRQGVKFIQADIADKENLKSSLNVKQFDYVFNLGGYIDHTPYSEGGRKLIESHYTGLMNLIDCLDTKRLKGFVQVGSSDEYGNAPAPQKEKSRESSISPYSLAKTASSHFIQMLSNTEGFPGVVIRLFLVYGPGQDYRRFIPQIIRACLRNECFKTSEGKQLRDLCYVEDVVEGIFKAAVTPKARGHVINIASGIPIPIKEVIEKVIKLSGSGKPIWDSYPYRKGENMQLWADISLAKNLLGFQADTGLNEGLKRTIEYYKKCELEERVE